MTWKTKDGQTLEITEMTDQHIFNAIRSHAARVEFEHKLDRKIEWSLGFALAHLYPLAEEAYKRQLYQKYPKMLNLSFENILGAIVQANSLYDTDRYDDESWHPGHPSNFGDR